MCGNGIRCLAKYLYEKGHTNKEEMTIETLAGLKTVKLIVENNKIMAVRINMGKPQTSANKLPIYLPQRYYNTNSMCKIMFRASDKDFEGIFLSVGNPHTVIKVKNVKEIQVAKCGRIIENYKFFPQKTNVEFVEKIDENNIRVRVWERGVGETLACGTGAVASAYAMYKEKEINNDVKVDLDGGSLRIYINPETEEVYMEGMAINVFEGEIDL